MPIGAQKLQMTWPPTKPTTCFTLTPSPATKVGNRSASQEASCTKSGLNRLWSITPAWISPNAALSSTIVGHPRPARRATSRISTATVPYSGPSTSNPVSMSSGLLMIWS